MQVEVGAVVEGTVTGITKFGAFVSLPDGRSGLVHISEIANTYVNDVNEFLKLGDKVKVRVLAITPDGQINLSIKKAEPAPERPNNRPMGGRPGGNRPNNGGAPRAARPNRPAQPAGQVSGPSGDAAFEDRLKQFMQESDSRMAGNRLYSDRTRGRRRGSGRGRAPKPQIRAAKSCGRLAAAFFSCPAALIGRRYLIRTKNRTDHRHAPLGSDCPQLRTPTPVLQQWKRLQKGKHKYIMSILRCACHEILPKRRRSEI